MQESKDGFKIVTDFASSSKKDYTIAGSSSLRLVAPGIYIPEWGLTQESLLTQHTVAYEWGRHAFPTATIEAL